MSRVSVRTVQTKVNVQAIQSHFRPGGAVRSEASRFGRIVKVSAIREAPSRTGTLKARHRGPFVATTPLGNHVTISNDSDHALFVHEGTHGPIVPHNPTGFLWVRPAPHSWYAPNFDPFGYGDSINAGGRIPRRSVRGQRANPWMARAMRKQVGRRYWRGQF